MRSIKFRAWHIKDKKMFAPSWINFEKKMVGVAADEEWASSDYGLVEVELIEFTGLHDKNGKEIYEGDIIKQSIEVTDFNLKNFGISKTEKHKAVIIFDRDNLMFIPQFKPKEVWHPLYECVRLCDSDAEVIGNIYEHPHLLENE